LSGVVVGGVAGDEGPGQGSAEVPGMQVDVLWALATAGREPGVVLVRRLVTVWRGRSGTGLGGNGCL